MNHYTTQIRYENAAPILFNAITKELEAWWGKQNKPIKEAGISFTVSWGDPWYEFRVLEFLQDEKVVWECTDANQIINALEGVTKEWVGTKVVWSLKPLDGDAVLLDFEHIGLVPDFICFEFCTKTWDYFLHEKLSDYLEKLT